MIEVIQPMLNNLERIGGEESVPTLVKLMNHPDEHIRDDARRALAVNPSHAAAQALGAQLMSRKMRSAKTTAGLIYALGERKQAGASKLIVGALGSKEPGVFVAAVKALGRLNEELGVNALMKRRGKESGFRRTLIDAVLLETRRSEVFEVFLADAESGRLRAEALLGMLLASDLSRASGAMASGNAALQVAVIEAAVQSNNAELYDLIAAHLAALPAHNQLKALVALELSGDRAYAQSVELLLQSDHALVQVNAANALARIGTSASVLALVAKGSEEALRALGQLSVDGVDAQLEKIAETGDSGSRSTAIQALANRGRLDLIPTFFMYASEEDRGVASTAVKMIATIGNESNIEALADLMIAQEKAPVSRDALNGIVKLMRVSPDQALAVKILGSKMEGASPRSQANILKVLAESGSKAALKPLIEACRSSNEQLQNTAVKALGGWKDVNGIPVLLELAADESISLTHHVILMRGVSRLYAGSRSRGLKKDEIRKAIDVCRRQEEKEALRATLKRAR
ncbi:MAG: HEAT repeat domain-containing protein [Pontiella sp.]